MKTEREELREEILDILSSPDVKVDMQNMWNKDIDSTLVKNLYTQLIHLLNEGLCRIIIKENGASVNIKYLDTELGYNYSLVTTYGESYYNKNIKQFSGNFELKKISPVTCKMIAEIYLGLGCLEESLMLKIIEFAVLNEKEGNSIKKMKKYSDIDKADTFETEYSKYVSKEIRLRKINSVLG
jgi:hypothetical protein